MAAGDKFLGRGWRFPVRPAGNGPRLVDDQDEAVQTAIFLILGTAPGERVMRPDFGCGIHDLVYQPNTVALRGTVAGRVRDALVRWEPRIDVLGVRADPHPDAASQLVVRIDYRVRGNNTLFNLVYPFFLTEGVE